MKVKDIDFGTSIGASGIQGFFGEGYWYHYLWYLLFPFWFRFRGMTFCSKTVLLPFRKGNTPMFWGRWVITPIQPKPTSIYVNPFKAVGVNAVGLPNEGLLKSLKRRRWQKRTKPFFISFAFHATDEEAQLEEAREFVRIMKIFLPEFKSQFGIQWNDSCPNTGHSSGTSKVDFIRKVLAIFAELGLPIFMKINALFPISLAFELESEKNLDGWVCSNTLFWDEVWEEERIRYFGSEESPLEKRWNQRLFFFGRKIFTIKNAKGGVSGRILFPYVFSWIRDARRKGIKKPIIAGGGIESRKEVRKYKEAGASAISPGGMAIYRPWNMKAVVHEARQLFRDS